MISLFVEEGREELSDPCSFIKAILVHLLIGERIFSDWISWPLCGIQKRLETKRPGPKL
jgi:hypothetical protein